MARTRDPNKTLPAPKPVQEQPVINWKQMSWGDTEDIAQLGVEINQATEAQDGAKLLELFVKMRVVITPLVSNIPRSWLVDRAPEPLDFSNGALRWLRNDKMLDLIGIIVDGEQASKKKAST